MIWILPCVLAKTIIKDVSLAEPAYLGRFGGSSVQYTFSSQISKDYKEINLSQASLQLFVTVEKKKYDCNYIEKLFLKQNVYVPEYGSWSHDQSNTFSLNNLGYFYLSDCKKVLSPASIVSVKLEIEDSINGHLSSESSGLLVSCVLFGLFLIFLILLLIRAFYQEKHDEAPLFIIFGLCMAYLLSILFNCMFIWIFLKDGTSYKLFLCFSRIFGVFADVSTIGIVLLIAFGKFNPKMFLIEENEFFVYLAMIFIEYFLSFIGIIRTEPMQTFEMYSNIEGIILVGLRGFYCSLIYRYQRFLNPGQAQTQGIFWIRIVGSVFILLPGILLAVYLQSSLFYIDCIMNLIQSLVVCAALFCLFIHFGNSSMVFILPMKSHKF